MKTRHRFNRSQQRPPAAPASSSQYALWPEYPFKNYYYWTPVAVSKLAGERGLTTWAFLFSFFSFSLFLSLEGVCWGFYQIHWLEGSVPAPTGTWTVSWSIHEWPLRLDLVTEGPDYPYPEGQSRHSGCPKRDDTKAQNNGFRLVSGKVVRRKRDESFNLTLYCPQSPVIHPTLLTICVQWKSPPLFLLF